MFVPEQEEVARHKEAALTHVLLEYDNSTWKLAFRQPDLYKRYIKALLHGLILMLERG
jgi:hypothetical protein